MNKIKLNKGFTLIELMIVLAVISILAAVAYPSYQTQVLKTRRGDAQANLLVLDSYMTRYFTENNTYAGAALPNLSTAYYQLTVVIDAGPPSTYTLTAAAQNTGEQASDVCGDMTLNYLGVRTKTGHENGCW